MLVSSSKTHQLFRFKIIQSLNYRISRPSSYQLFTHNCNNFSEEIAQFLCGKSIPKYILDLPNEALQSNLGPAIQALVQQLERSAYPIEDEQAESHKRQAREASPDLVQLNSRIEEERSAVNRKRDHD